MVAPLIGAAAAAAARLVAKKLATKAVKKTVTTPKQAALKKKAASSVKVVKPRRDESREAFNTTSSISTNLASSATRSKAVAKSREKAIAASRADGTMAKPVQIKSGGNIKPATPKKTMANNPANVGNAPKKSVPSAQQSIDAARKALGSTKPDPKALARRITQDKAREMERIRRQGRNTR